MKYLIIISLLLSFTFSVQAQDWNREDSLRLSRIMAGDEEIELNKKAIQSIDMGSGLFGDQMIVEDKKWLQPDITLPIPNDAEQPFNMRQMLSLRPYNGSTPLNWDPVYRKRIKVANNTWRNDPFYKLSTIRIYSNWAKRWNDAGDRNSLEKIEASGLRYNTFAERANGQMVGAWQRISDGPSGIDFNYYTSKDFWDFKGRKIRARTLEVLGQYGDSTTVLVSQPIIFPITK